MNRSRGLLLARFLLGGSGLLLSSIGLWIGRAVLETGSGGPFAIYAALLAVALGTVVAYAAYDPKAVR